MDYKIFPFFVFISCFFYNFSASSLYYCVLVSNSEGLKLLISELITNRRFKTTKNGLFDRIFKILIPLIVKIFKNPFSRFSTIDQ